MFQVVHTGADLESAIDTCLGYSAMRVTRPSGGINDWLHWLPVSLHKKLDYILRRIYGDSRFPFAVGKNKLVPLPFENGYGAGLSALLEADAKQIARMACDTFENISLRMQCVLRGVTTDFIRGAKDRKEYAILVQRHRAAVVIKRQMKVKVAQKVFMNSREASMIIQSGLMSFDLMQLFVVGLSDVLVMLAYLSQPDQWYCCTIYFSLS
ncbi:hypothetical protein IFM89_024695 [Coptis chinensis]|uniref:Uncharacterized protein n=1 Tax=Coptis chinensis TaxID=261450 RepID=A0A835ID35_9MAGN|nr:hypothetical protein IFM89_024695 [Coptis chinensis]